MAVRFVIKRKWRDVTSWLETEEYETILCDVPELESVLRGGGYGENGYDWRGLVGAEVVDAS